MNVTREGQLMLLGHLDLYSEMVTSPLAQLVISLGLQLAEVGVEQLETVVNPANLFEAVLRLRKDIVRDKLQLLELLLALENLLNGRLANLLRLSRTVEGSHHVSRVYPSDHLFLSFNGYSFHVLVLIESVPVVFGLLAVVVIQQHRMSGMSLLPLIPSRQHCLLLQSTTTLLISGQTDISTEFLLLVPLVDFLLLLIVNPHGPLSRLGTDSFFVTAIVDVDDGDSRLGRRLDHLTQRDEALNGTIMMTGHRRDFREDTRHARTFLDE